MQELMGWAEDARALAAVALAAIVVVAGAWGLIRSAAVAAAGSARSSWPGDEEIGRLARWSVLAALSLPQIGVLAAALFLGLTLVVAGAPALVLFAAAVVVAGGLAPRACAGGRARRCLSHQSGGPRAGRPADAVAGAEPMGGQPPAPRCELAGAVRPMSRGEAGAPAADRCTAPKEQAAARAQSLEPPAAGHGHPAPWLNTDEAVAPLGLYRVQQAPDPAAAGGAGRASGQRPPERASRPVPPPDDRVRFRRPMIAAGFRRRPMIAAGFRRRPMIATGFNRPPIRLSPVGAVGLSAGGRPSAVRVRFRRPMIATRFRRLPGGAGLVGVVGVPRPVVSIEFRRPMVSAGFRRLPGGAGLVGVVGVARAAVAVGFR